MQAQMRVHPEEGYLQLQMSQNQVGDLGRSQLMAEVQPSQTEVFCLGQKFWLHFERGPSRPSMPAWPPGMGLRR